LNQLARIDTSIVTTTDFKSLDGFVVSLELVFVLLERIRALCKALDKLRILLEPES
jgi:hypothetical protein